MITVLNVALKYTWMVSIVFIEDRSASLVFPIKLSLFDDNAQIRKNLTQLAWLNFYCPLKSESLFSVFVKWRKLLYIFPNGFYNTPRKLFRVFFRYSHKASASKMLSNFIWEHSFSLWTSRWGKELLFFWCWVFWFYIVRRLVLAFCRWIFNPLE